MKPIVSIKMTFSPEVSLALVPVQNGKEVADIILK